jgi:hypothetical protein
VNGVISEWEILVIASLLISIFVSTVACVAVYFLWGRRMSRKVIEMQLTLFKLASFLQKNAAATQQPVSAQAATEPAKRIAMSFEGRTVEIVAVGGKETVRFEEPMSQEERARILAYLKDEGFIS